MVPDLHSGSIWLDFGCAGTFGEKMTKLCEHNSFTVRFVVTEACFLEFFRLIKKINSFTAKAKYANQLRVDSRF